jgi:hypothetical protein
MRKDTKAVREAKDESINLKLLELVPDKPRIPSVYLTADHVSKPPFLPYTLRDGIVA